LVLTGTNNNFQYAAALASGSHNIGTGMVKWIDDNGFLTPDWRYPGGINGGASMYSSVLNAGRLIIGENSSIGAVFFNNNSRTDVVLGGSGTTGTVVFISGIVSPGMGQNSMETGTLKVHGHYWQATDANAAASTTLWIDMGRGGNYDKLAVSGSAVLETRSKMRLWNPSGYMMPGKYEFLTAQLGISGSIAAADAEIVNSLTLTIVDADNPVKKERKFDGSESLSVTLRQEKFAEVEGLTKGQRAVGEYLDHLVSLGDPGDVDSIDPLVGYMNGKAARVANSTALELDENGKPATTLRMLMDAMNQISPSHYVHVYEAAIASLNTITEGVERHTNRPHAGKNAEKFSLYANLDYDSVTTNESDDVEAAKLKTFYYTLGGSKYLGEKLIVGGEFSYGSGVYKTDGTASKTDATLLTLNLYGALKTGRLGMGALALLGADKYKTRRNVSATHVADFMESDADGSRYGLGGWINYAIPAGDYTIKPYASLHWMNWKMDGFKETGSESLALDVAEQSANIFESRAGVRVESTFYAVNLSNRAYRMFLDLGWVSLLDGAGARVIDTSLNGFAMNVEVPALKRTGWRGSVGALVDLTNSLKFQLEATGQLDGGLDKQFSYQGSFIYKF
jgi:outer membrane autotransporter protein